MMTYAKRHSKNIYECLFEWRRARGRPPQRVSHYALAPVYCSEDKIFRYSVRIQRYNTERYYLRYTPGRSWRVPLMAAA